MSKIYRTCEKCGANLDPGERCDCEEKERGQSHSNGNSPQGDSPYMIIAQIHNNCNYPLGYIRNKGISAKEIVATVKDSFPRYDKTLQSKCEHPEYGVDLTAPALVSVIRKFAPELLNATQEIDSPKPKRADTHRLKKSVKCRLTDETYNKLLNRIQHEGWATVQEWLASKIHEYLKTERN